MNRKRIIAVILTASLVLGSSLAVGATEAEDIQVLTDQESESEEEVTSEETEPEEVETETEEISEEIVADEEDVDVLPEEDEEIEEEAESDEEAESEDGFGNQLSTDTSGQTELAEIDPALIGYIVETGIQTYAEYPSFSYSYTYETFTKTVDGHTGDEILEKTVDIVVANEGGYNSVLANDNNSGALSIGKIGWHADLALTLTRLIVAEDNATAWKLLGEDLYNEVIKSSTSWSSRVLTNSEVTIMENFLDPNQNPASKTIQDKLAKSYVADYVTKAYNLGIRNAAALVYYADIHNQYGNTGGSMGGAKACANYAYNIAGDWSKVTLNELHLAAISNVAHNYASRSTIKAYLERRRSTYGKLASCGWTYCNSGDYTIPYNSDGSNGAAWLQVALNYYQNAGLTVTGKYDDALKVAVKTYQTSVGLDADGLAGLHTSTKLIHDMYYTAMQTYGAAPSISTSVTGTDIVKINGKWIYTVDGVADYSYTGLAKNSKGWWYVEKGVVNFNYTGFAENSNGKWYCEDSKVTFNANSVYKDTSGAIGTKGNWYYVVGSKVQTSFTGLANYKNSNGWWYIKNGIVDFTAHGVYKNKNGWWYVDGGKVIFSYNGFASNSNGKWYIEDGKVTFSKNSVLKDTTGAIGTKGDWYYVVESKVQTSFTGLANYRNSYGWWYIKKGIVDFTAHGVYKNKNGWWYVDGGKVIFSYNGFASNSNGKWYIEDGKVTFNKNSVLKDTTGAIGTKGDWYYVVGSKVQTSFTGLANYRNSYGWWYIKNGVVDFTAEGVYKNKNGWWYVTGGKVDFGFNGIAQNSNGWWYIKDGKVDFSFTGTVTANGTKYSVTEGKVAK